jgi:hypothetical protein
MASPLRYTPATSPSRAPLCETNQAGSRASTPPRHLPERSPHTVHAKENWSHLHTEREEPTFVAVRLLLAGAHAPVIDVVCGSNAPNETLPRTLANAKVAFVGPLVVAEDDEFIYYLAHDWLPDLLEPLGAVHMKSFGPTSTILVVGDLLRGWGTEVDWSSSPEARQIRHQEELQLAGKRSPIWVISFAEFVERYALEAIVNANVSRATVAHVRSASQRPRAHRTT